MGTMDGWTLALMAIGGYVAVVALVRLMLHRRSELMAKFRQEVEAEKARRKKK